MQNKFLSSLGLAKRAGRAVVGTDAVRDTMKSKKAKMVIVASDVSDNTRKEILDTSVYYGAEAVIVPYTMSELSHALGKMSLVACVAITDISLTTLVKNSLEHQEV